TKPPAPWRRCKSVYRTVLKSFTVLAKFYKLQTDDEEPVLERVFEDFRDRGFLLILAEARGEGEPAHVGLFPTTENYAVLVACETDGANYGHSTIDIIAW